MTDPSKLIPFAAAFRRPNPAHFAEISELAQRVRRERSGAEELVLTALRETPRAWWPRLAERPDLQNTGVVDRLGKEVEKRLDSDPREALAIAELAAAIADALASGAYPAVMIALVRANAWKDRCRALAYLGRYDEALRAITRSEAILEPFGSVAHDRATIRFCRATLLQHMLRFDEAHELLDECRVVFRGHGDRALEVKCTVATGILLARKGDYWAARETLTPLLTDESLAGSQAHMSMGWCDIHLGAPDSAITHFNAAARGCRRLGRELEATRATYGLGSAMLRLHQFTDAIKILRSTRKIFLERGLIEEGGLSGLGIVEAQLVLGQNSEARALAASLVQEFSAANLNRRAVAALAYLNDAIAASSATPEIVRDVHAYIIALQTDPTRDFARAN
jgi:tetratricopeptide (TPR) repeat protein